MIPIRDVNPTRRRPWITLAVIAANIAIFLLWQPTFSHSEPRTFFFFYCRAEIPYETTHQTSLADGGVEARRAIESDLGGEFGSGVGEALQLELQEECPNKSWLASVFVAMFLHGGWLHIAGNMLFLWIFGNNIEDSMSRWRFALFYLLGGLIASFAQVGIDPQSTVPTIGASGAIAAVLGGYALLYPKARVTTLVIIIVFITVIQLPALLVLALWFLLQLLYASAELSQPLSGEGGGVAYFAHMGGFVAGLALIKLFANRVHADYERAHRAPVY